MVPNCSLSCSLLEPSVLSHLLLFVLLPVIVLSNERRQHDGNFMVLLAV